MPKKGENKTVKLQNYTIIRNDWLLHVDKCKGNGTKLYYKKYFRDKVYPQLTETEQQTYHFGDFYAWSKTKDGAGIDRPRKTLMEREREKQIRQLEIRQDSTELMGDWLLVLKELVKDPAMMIRLGEKQILAIYKIIREEEDRAKLLSLKERSENRADAQFAFVVSMARANQITEEDILHLSEDIKKELLVFKQKNGIYQLDAPNQVAGVFPPAEDSPALPDNGTEEGSL